MSKCNLLYSPTQRRVLGVLIEKSLTTPDQYPLTFNAIVADANQKSNRDPVADYSESEITDVLQELRHKELIRQADPDKGRGRCGMNISPVPSADGLRASRRSLRN